MVEPALKITMRCRDLAASRRFYRDVLGLPLVDEWSEAHGDGCVFAVGRGRIELNEAHRAGSHLGSDPGHGRGAFDVQIEVDDLDIWVGRMAGRVDFEGPKDHSWGERTVRLRDPDGVLLTIYQQLG